jgi:hypothetical protein
MHRQINQDLAPHDFKGSLIIPLLMIPVRKKNILDWRGTVSLVVTQISAELFLECVLLY